MKGYVLHGAADDDLVHGARYSRRDYPDAAMRFLDHAFEAFDFIAGWPEGSPTARLSARRHRGIWLRPLPRPFQNYLLFYQIKSDEVRIYRVLHGLRIGRRTCDCLAGPRVRSREPGGRGFRAADGGERADGHLRNFGIEHPAVNRQRRTASSRPPKASSQPPNLGPSSPGLASAR